MKLAPHMIQSMEILQMPMQALEARVEQELSTNPTLEVREIDPDEVDTREERIQSERDASEGERELVVDRNNADGKDDFERLSNFADEQRDTWDSNYFETGDGFRPARRFDGERDQKMDAMANTAARGASLSEQLLDQWRFADVAPDMAAVGEYLISFIDDDGYIRTDVAAMSRQAPRGLRADLIEVTITKLQNTLEPPGMAARNLTECLLLQMDARERSEPDEDYTIERRILTECQDDLEGNRIPRIARKLDVEIEDVNRAIQRMRHFQPRPGRSLVEAAPHAITPDAIVEYDEDADQYVALMTNSRMPALRVSPEYAKMARDKTVDRNTRDFVGRNLQSARWLLDAIEQRNNTIMRVIAVVLEAQRDFFDQGESALKPLPMTGVAEQLGIHVATVSRAVNEKYLQTPRGVFPLRMFFSGGTETDDGDAMSWTAVQAKLREVIDAENKSSPLSDDALVKEMRKHGIELARRTVAKYRSEMNIPSARQRKEYGNAAE